MPLRNTFHYVPEQFVGIQPFKMLCSLVLTQNIPYLIQRNSQQHPQFINAQCLISTVLNYSKSILSKKTLLLYFTQIILIEAQGMVFP